MLFRYGKFTVDNLIHLVLDSTHDLQPTLWYICEYNSWKNLENWPITRPESSSPSFSEREAATTKKDLSLKQEGKQDQQLIIQREKNLEQKEKNLEQKEKNLAQKETLLQQKLLQAELREREALEFEQEAKIKLDEVDEKEQELEAEKEKLALKKNKIKNKNKGTTSSHDAENSDDDDNPTTNNENYNNDNQWLLRFSNLQQRLETAYREIENLRRPVFPAAETTNITATTATATANGDDNNNNNNDDNDDENEDTSSIITSLQRELKLTKENAQKQKEENIFLWEKLKEAKNQGRRSKMDFDEANFSSVGNRWAPLDFRVERMRREGGEGGMGSATGSATTTRSQGEEEGVGMIEMQKEFRFLGRLR